VNKVRFIAIVNREIVANIVTSGSELERTVVEQVLAVAVAEAVKKRPVSFPPSAVQVTAEFVS
jgi:hypothetical protein